MFTVSTTRPKLENFLKISPITTKSKRLRLRPLEERDLEAYWAIACDGKTMARFWNRPEPHNPYNNTSYALQDMLEPIGQGLEKLVSFGIFLLHGEVEELIGRGGVQMSKGTWPSAWYFIEKKSWDKGYITEFLKELLEYWWGLEREDVKVDMYNELSSLEFVSSDSTKAKEVLCAWPSPSNGASQRVLEKNGFKRCETPLHEKHQDNQFWFYTKKD